MKRLLCALPVLALFTACPGKKPVDPEPDAGVSRCEVDLKALGLFSEVGSGVKARVITADADLVGGPFSQGAKGDFLLENDKIRVTIQRPFRQIAATPYGGTIIDADLKRAAGEAPRDQMGKLEVLYSFGRTINVKSVEVLKDGSAGGYAVIAATGDDAVNDYVNVNNVIAEYLGEGTKLTVDPNKALTIKATTYYVLSPGENRVRVLTAFCNEGEDPISSSVGDLFEQGGESDFFNPGSCTKATGAKGCLVDSSPWYGYQANEVAYAVRPYKLTDLKSPEPKSALLYVSGVVAVLASGEDQAGLLKWIDPMASSRPGTFPIRPGTPKNYLRDFHVGRHLGDIVSQFATVDAVGKSRLNVTAQKADGSAAAFARIAVRTGDGDRQVTLLVADKDGKASTDLPAGSYQVSTGAMGYAIEAPVTVNVPSTGETSATVKLGATQVLSVSVADPFGKPLTARVTVLCPSGPCPFEFQKYKSYFEIDDSPSTVAAMAFIGASGAIDVNLPPGQYQVMVSRGPEYSFFPDTAPNAPLTVDLTSAPALVKATLARVVDTTGYLSADLHVHAVASADSSVGNTLRTLTYAAEGVDVLVSTDHDMITDYAPIITALGINNQMASMIGCEVTPFDYGHQQAYPLVRNASDPSGGAFDWAGGDGASLRLDELYSGLKAAHPDVVLQMNHPRGSGGSLTTLKVDTATGATHQTPETFRMNPAPGATANDTKLLSNLFDAIEVQNGLNPNYAVLNDWMTFMSRGLVKTATGVSDSHNVSNDVGGYARTWVRVGTDDVTKFDSKTFAEAIKAHRAISSGGPFITLKAQVVGETKIARDIGDTLSVPTGKSVELTVDVQAPEWMTFDSIEIYTHTTGREALNGDSNSSWPDARIHAQKKLDPTMLTVEPVPNLNGFAARRIHEVAKFTVTPAADTWYVAMVRSGSASRLFFPLAWHGVTCKSGVCTANDARGVGFTNAILIDADGTGKYDTFPIKQGLAVAPPPKKQAVAHVPTNEEFSEALRKMLTHSH